MHPSLNHACEVLQLGERMAAGFQGLEPRRSGSRRAPSARVTTHLLQRSATCLELLAGVAIDRAVAAGTESILVEAA